MSYEVTIDHESGRHLAVHEFDVRPEEMTAQMGEAFGAVMNHLTQVGAAVAGPAASCYQMSEGMDEMDGMHVAAGFVVASPVEPGPGVEPFQLPDVDTATTMHVGAYDQLGDAYNALRDGAREQGREVDPAGLMWEEYVTEPDLPPAELRTLVHWSLLPVAG